MKKYEYPFLAKLFYRYANIPATILLSIHLISSLLLIGEQWIFILPALINTGVIYILNRFYYKIYKYFPFEISLDNETMVCSDFMYGQRKIEIKLSNIDNIEGGVFTGHMTKPIYIHDKTQNITLGFYQHIKDYNQFITTILSNINKKLYNRLLDEMKSRGDKKRSGKNKKAR